MSTKVLALPNSEYRIKIKESGNLYLDTGTGTGTVIVTGNLTVAGTQSTVTSTNLDIKDNILTLNKGEQGTGITLTQSGLQIDRGSLVDAKFVFDETVTWVDPTTDTTITGGFTLVNACLLYTSPSPRDRG